MMNAMPADPWSSVIDTEAPILATAIHAGSSLRREVAQLHALSPIERLREEDPHTDEWARISPSRIVVHRSRFEFDVNRPPEKAVYLSPDDAWGLRCWGSPPPDSLVADSRRLHSDFFRYLDGVIADFCRTHSRTVVLDIHSYNHRRLGPTATAAPTVENPDFIVGTGTMTDRPRWDDVVSATIETLRSANGDGPLPFVAENVKFRGGAMAKHLHTEFAGRVGVLSIELKKTYMDEWTGVPDSAAVRRLVGVFENLVARIVSVLSQ